MSMYGRIAFERQPGTAINGFSRSYEEKQGSLQRGTVVLATRLRDNKPKGVVRRPLNDSLDSAERA
jgi:hypothetical protein